MWKEIKNTKGFYQVSNDGQLKSVARFVNYKHGGKPRLWPEKIIKGYKGHNGYMEADLKIEGVRRKVIVHRMVAEAFISNPDKHRYVNHKDGDKMNNNVENLEWCTNGENVRHSFESGHHSGRGSTHYKAKKITDGTKEFGTLQEAGDYFGVSRKVIHDALSGRISNRFNISYVTLTPDTTP